MPDADAPMKMSQMSRRQFLRAAALVGAATALPTLLTACFTAPKSSPSSGGPALRMNQKQIKIGFIPLTDCASVVMAKELGLFAKYGVMVEVTKEASWANVRDKLLTGDLNAAHCLFGMPFSVYTGVGGMAGKELPIAMMLSNNGQAITLAKELEAVGRDVSKVKAAILALQAAGKESTFAMTFPGGTHDMWLRVWLANTGLDQSKLKIITIPPPQMVANMKVGNMVGYSVGEPWNGVGVKQDVGFTHITSQEVWKHHPEKALVLNKEWSGRKEEVKAVMKAVLEASIWLDQPQNRKEAAKVIGGPAYVNAPADVVEARLMGEYELGGGLGKQVYSEDSMLFYRDGKVNFPRHSHAIWFMAQYVRFGYLKSAPEYEQIAKRLIMQELYKEVAAEMSMGIPEDDMKPFTVDLDQQLFDPNDVPASLQKYGGA